MIYTAIALLFIIVAWEYLRNVMLYEGFSDGVVPEFFGRYFPRRYDVTPGQFKESDGWIRNPRYFEGYVDLQRLGYKGDFCRVVEKENIPESRIVACALAGQEGLDPFTYRSDSARAGMKFSRDDYFRDVNQDGREDYGRILKVEQAPNDRWEAKVLLANLVRFSQTDVTDNDPPQEIKDLLWFYEGIMVWYRFFDDMVDYGDNTQIQIAGQMKIEETTQTKRTDTKGCAFNTVGADQYIKIGENSRLEFDTQVQLRQLRAISVWVYFQEFTNNARIFDFGNGAGKDNVIFGIEGKGNTTGAFGKLGSRPNEANEVCSRTPAKEVSPQEFLQSSDANVNDYECPGPDAIPSTYPEDEETQDIDPKANLLFEIWDTQQRKMRMRVLNAIPLRKWVHIAVTTTDSSSFRPTWQVYIDGKKVYEMPDGHMALKSYTTNNYLGRSNWEGQTSQYQDADERFKGRMFDFRLYRTPMSKSKIQKTVEWGKKKLVVETS